MDHHEHLILTTNFDQLLRGIPVQIDGAVYKLFRRGETVPTINEELEVPQNVTCWLGRQMSTVGGRAVYVGAELTIEQFINQLV